MVRAVQKFRCIFAGLHLCIADDAADSVSIVFHPVSQGLRQRNFYVSFHGDIRHSAGSQGFQCISALILVCKNTGNSADCRCIAAHRNIGSYFFKIYQNLCLAFVLCGCHRHMVHRTFASSGKNTDTLKAVKCFAFFVLTKCERNILQGHILDRSVNFFK